jgi:VWFA-related protein
VKALAALGLCSLIGLGPQTFRTGTQVVTLTVSVADKRRPVAGLQASDFLVVDNGAPQTVELLPPSTVPLDVTIVVGAYGLRVVGARLEPAIKQLIGWLQPQDRVRVISHARDVVEVVSLRAPTALPTGDWLRDIWFANEPVDHREDPRLRGAASWDAILLALATPLERDRRAVVIDFWTEDGFGSSVTDGALVAAAAARSPVLFYVASAPGVTEPAPTTDTFHGYQQARLKEVAEATGGEVREVGGGVGGFRSTLDLLRASYVLRYTVTGVSNPGWHQLSVTVPNHTNYTVRTRRGYLGG